MFLLYIAFSVFYLGRGFRGGGGGGGNVIFSLYDGICSNIRVRQRLATESCSSSAGCGSAVKIQPLPSRNNHILDYNQEDYVEQKDTKDFMKNKFSL